MTASTLTAPTTYVSSRGVWSIAAKHTRSDGGLDVVLAFRPNTPALNRRLYGFRYTPVAGWRQVLLAHPYTVPGAVRGLADGTDTRAIAYRALVPLLDAAAGLDDHPALPAAHQQTDDPDPDAAYKAGLEDVLTGETA